MAGTLIPWKGIPETYWPDSEKPWRVTFGIGCFQDFATEAEALDFYERERQDGDLMRPPFNAAEREVS